MVYVKKRKKIMTIYVKKGIIMVTMELKLKRKIF